jgi:hypothetical protein
MEEYIIPDPSIELEKPKNFRLECTIMSTQQ